jgi:hypothetical protein
VSPGSAGVEVRVANALRVNLFPIIGPIIEVATARGMSFA